MLRGGVQWPDIEWYVTDKLTQASPAAGAADHTFPAPDRNASAFLQFTSGSTSDPKGVMITHGNLAHNLDIIVTNLKAVEDTVVVSWLPQ